jgi:WD40 repeat protein
MSSVTASARVLRPETWARTGQTTLEDFVRALAWSPGERRLLAVTLAGTAHLRNTAGVWLGVPGLHNGGAFACAWSPDGSRFVTGGGDGRVFLHDARSTCLVGEAHVDDGWVEHVAWSPDGARFAASAGRTVRFFTRDAARVGDRILHEGVVTSLHWLASRTAVLTTSHGGAQLVSPREGVAERWPSDGAILVARVSRDGRWLALGKHEGIVHLWDLARRRETVIAGYPRKIGALAWSDRAPLLASAGGKEIAVWTFDEAGARESDHVEIAPHRGVVRALALTPDGERLVSIGEDGLLHVARTGSWRTELLDATEVPLSSLALSADGRSVAASGKQGRVFTWRRRA